MFTRFLTPTILLTSSLIIFLLNFYQTSITLYHQIILLLIVIVLGLNRFLFESSEVSTKSVHWSNLALLFISSLLIQLLVVSTGGFYSPLLILFHLFALTISFLLNFSTSLSFLLFSLLTLAIIVYTNASQLEIFKADPGTALLYLISFMVIVPLMKFVSTKYHLKDELSKILGKQVRLGAHILESLNEMVIITDTKLRVISVNEAVKRTLKLTDPEIIGKFLFDLLDIKDSEGRSINLGTLGVSDVINSRTARLVSDLFLYTQNRAAPFQISIQTRPIIGADGGADQLSFVIYEGGRETKGAFSHIRLQKAIDQHKVRLDQLKEELKSLGYQNLQLTAGLLDMVEEDLLVALELEDHSIEQREDLVDIAFMARDVVAQQQNFAKALHTKMIFSLPAEETKEASRMALEESGLTTNTLPVSDFFTVVNEKWAKILIARLTTLAILLASTLKNGSIQVFVTKLEARIDIEINSNFPLDPKLQQLLITPYYGELVVSTNLKLGSGLEGFIAKSIAVQLSIPIEIRSNVNPPFTRIVIHLTKAAR